MVLILVVSANLKQKKTYFTLIADMMNTHLRITCIQTGIYEYFPNYQSAYVRQDGSKYHIKDTLYIVERVFLVTEY